MEVTCFDNMFWFGTVGKTYKVLNCGIKTLKDVRYIGDDYTYEYYTVTDDKEQEVDIPKECFKQR